MPERDIDTEALYPHDAPPMPCTQPPTAAQACRYAADRQQLAASSRRVERRLDEIAGGIGEVRESLARGGVHIDALRELPARVDAHAGLLAQLEAARQTLCGRLTLVERVVYGGCAIILIAALTAGLALIFRSSAP
jgi:hypothetical protein